MSNKCNVVPGDKAKIQIWEIKNKSERDYMQNVFHNIFEKNIFSIEKCSLF